MGTLIAYLFTSGIAHRVQGFSEKHEREVTLTSWISFMEIHTKVVESLSFLPRVIKRAFSFPKVKFLLLAEYWIVSQQMFQKASDPWNINNTKRNLTNTMIWSVNVEIFGQSISVCIEKSICFSGNKVSLIKLKLLLAQDIFWIQQNLMINN